MPWTDNFNRKQLGHPTFHDSYWTEHHSVRRRKQRNIVTFPAIKSNINGRLASEIQKTHSGGSCYVAVYSDALTRKKKKSIYISGRLILQRVHSKQGFIQEADASLRQLRSITSKGRMTMSISIYIYGRQEILPKDSFGRFTASLRSTQVRMCRNPKRRMKNGCSVSGRRVRDSFKTKTHSGGLLLNYGQLMLINKQKKKTSAEDLKIQETHSKQRFIQEVHFRVQVHEPEKEEWRKSWASYRSGV